VGALTGQIGEEIGRDHGITSLPRRCRPVAQVALVALHFLSVLPWTRNGSAKRPDTRGRGAPLRGTFARSRLHIRGIGRGGPGRP